MRVRELQTHLYLLEAQKPPVDAPDEWYDPSSPSYVRDTPRDAETLLAFLRASDGLYEDVGNLSTSATPEEIQALFYHYAKITFGEEKNDIREFFKLLYLVIFQRDSGPRWGEFINIIGKDKFLEIYRERFSNVLSLPT